MQSNTQQKEFQLRSYRQAGNTLIVAYDQNGSVIESRYITPIKDEKEIRAYLADLCQKLGYQEKVQ